MKLKLDENLGRRGVSLLKEAGHEVYTVADQGLQSASDTEVIGVCQEEGACLVSLDLEFGNPTVYNPSEYSGIAVIRIPPRASLSDLHDAIGTLVRGLSQSDIAGRLWVVQRGFIRVYQPDN